MWQGNYFLILLVFFAISCVDPLNQEKFNEPQFAISSFFTADTSIQVKIIPLQTAFASIGLNTSYFIDEVRIVKVKTGDYYTLEKNLTDTLLYENKNIKIKQGDILRLEVRNRYSNLLALAVDSLDVTVLKFDIQNVSVNSIDPNEAAISQKCLVKLDHTGLKMGYFYELIAYTKILDENVPMSKRLLQQDLETNTSFITSEDYYPSSTDIDPYYPASLLFKVTDPTNDLIIDFNYLPGLGSGANGFHIPKHLLIVEFREVSSAYYRYKTAVYKQKNAIEGDEIYGSASPVFIPSNVENATGVFAGYIAVYKSIIVDEVYIK